MCSQIISGILLKPLPRISYQHLLFFLNCVELCYLMFTAVLSATVELVDKQLVILVHWLLLGGSPLARQNPNISLSESGNTLVQLRASSKPECGVAESKAEILNLV